MPFAIPSHRPGIFVPWEIAPVPLAGDFFNFSNDLPSRCQWHPVPDGHLPLLRVVGLYDPPAILAITNQFNECAICLHATKQTLDAFFWQAVSN
jgi:hypothetical protein